MRPFLDGDGGGLFFLGGLFHGGLLPEEERSKYLREGRRLDGLGGRLEVGRFLVRLVPWRLCRGIRAGVDTTRFRLFPAAGTAAAEAAAEAAGSSGVCFVLLLPTADACAEASEKDKHDDDDKGW